MQPSENLVVAERFRLIRMLGRGGMGSVWLAHHMGLDIPCAVKFIEGPHATSAEAQARFGREARAAAALRSPHVVQILDHGVWQGTPYMAMELLDGEDLGKRLNRLGRMSPAEACVIVAQVARALTKAHGAGIVHRDLKPDNIFLVRDDDREIAKVLDFGIAKQSGQALEGGATKTGALLGTPYYMSPEQAQGVKAVDHRSDLWSLAVIVYQALMGLLPFESDALGDLLMRIIMLPLPVPSQVMPGLLPLQFDRWWEKAANRDPGQRYQSARELSDALALVFGQSQATDVMDRADMANAMAMHGPGATQAMGAGAPSPGQFAQSPAPYMTPQPGGPGPHLVTGAPIAHTFGHATPPRSAAAPVLIVSGVIALLGLVGGGAFVASRSGHGGAASGSAATPTPASAPAAAPQAPVAPSTASTPAATGPTPTAPPSASSPPAASTPPAAPPAPPAAPPAAAPAPRPAAAPAQPARPAAPKPGKKPADDLGI